MTQMIELVDKDIKTNVTKWVPYAPEGKWKHKHFGKGFSILPCPNWNF